jgi:hypothetical protein
MRGTEARIRNAKAIEGQNKDVGRPTIGRPVIQGETFEQHDILYLSINKA